MIDGKLEVGTEGSETSCKGFLFLASLGFVLRARYVNKGSTLKLHIIVRIKMANTIDTLQ